MTTASEALDRAMEQNAADARRQVVGRLWEWWNAREARLEAEKVENSIKPAVRQYLELNESEEMVADAEHGVLAELGKPSTVTWWDVRPLTDAQIVGLARLGLLTVQTKAFDALKKAAPSTLLDAVAGTAGVRNEGAGTRDLNIKRIAS